MSLAYNVGYNARLYDNAKLKDCPYLRGSFLYTDWCYGWNLCNEQCLCAKKA
jgi:hypothetical protein